MKPNNVFHVDNWYTLKIVIINVIAVAMLRIDKIYLGGSLREVGKKMSSKVEKGSKAEIKLRNYIQKKYGKINPSLVNEDLSYEEWIRRFHETINQRRLSK